MRTPDYEAVEAAVQEKQQSARAAERERERVYRALCWGVCPTCGGPVSRQVRGLRDIVSGRGPLYVCEIDGVFEMIMPAWNDRLLMRGRSVVDR